MSWKSKLPAGFLVVVSLIFFGLGCSDRSKEVNDGVDYATRALEQVNGNPLARATYEGVLRNGGTPVDYINTILPKENPPFDSFEYENPTHEWTVVVRPGTQPNEFFIEGYGRDLKKPMKVETVTVVLPESEYIEEP